MAEQFNESASGIRLQKVGTGILASSGVLASPAGVTAVADNSFFRSQVDTGKLNLSIIRPVKTVVVGQDPPPGDQVPAGTPVNLRVARIDDIPLSSLKETGGLKANTLGELQASITPAIQAVLAKADDFNSLSANDKGMLVTFVGTEVDASKAFPAMKLVANL